MAVSIRLLVVLTTSCVGMSDASAFLSQPQGGGQGISIKDLEEVLLSELFSVAKRAHIEKFEKELSLMYAVLPKGEHGRLDSSTVRYALHRYFVQKHGWHMNGLDRAAESVNSSSKGSILKARAPTYIQSLFEKQQGKGLNLHQLAVFAATLSDLVHNEAVDSLNTIFGALGLPLKGPVDAEMSEAATKAYLVSYLLDGVVGKSKNQLKILERELIRVYPAWGETQMWVSDLRNGYKFRLAGRLNPFVHEVHDFDKVVGFVQEVGHNLGRFQNLECHELKAKLVEMEYQGTGRVRLSHFYAAGLASSDWQFAESVTYLRQIGALDESDARYPAVVIPNYVSGQSNCLLSSSFYSVCCMNECESLYATIEKEIMGPSAQPDIIVMLVSNLQSDTVSAPRNLSTALLTHLNGIAERHGGLVPLHGRLFAQWMHHAYPRECVFPHPTGTTRPMTPSQWLKETGSKYVATESEMQAYINLTMHTPVTEEADAIPWLAEEELVTDTPLHERSSWPIARFVIAVSALASLALSLVRSARTAMPRSDDKARVDKFLV